MQNEKKCDLLTDLLTMTRPTTEVGSLSLVAASFLALYVDPPSLKFLCLIRV